MKDFLDVPWHDWCDKCCASLAWPLLVSTHSCSSEAGRGGFPAWGEKDRLEQKIVNSLKRNYAIFCDKRKFGRREIEHSSSGKQNVFVGSLSPRLSAFQLLIHCGFVKSFLQISYPAVQFFLWNQDEFQTQSFLHALYMIQPSAVHRGQGNKADLRSSLYLHQREKAPLPQSTNISQLAACCLLKHKANQPSLLHDCAIERNYYLKKNPQKAA